MSEPRFGSASGRGIRVGVADSGVNPRYRQVGSVAGGVDLRWRQGRLEEGSDYQDLLGHGTAVAATIRGHAPEAALYVIRIFRRRLATQVEVLLGAMDWATGRGLDLLNLSLGTTNPEHRQVLEAAVRRAAKQGLFVVAAVEASGEPSFPGALPEVLGVGADPELGQDRYRCQPKRGATYLRASPWARDIPGLPRERNFHGASLAVANLTGIAARAFELQRPRSASELVRILCSKSA